MTISPMRYPGSKNKLIPVIMEYLDPLLINSDAYSESFIGGGALGLHIAQKYPKILLFFNDKDPWIASFLSVVSGDFNQLQELLMLLDQPVTIEYFYKLSQTIPSSNVERAYHCIFFNRTCFSGIVKRDEKGYVKSSPIGGRDQKSKYTVSCRYNAKKLKEKIIHCHKLLTGRVFVSNLDIIEYLDLINKDMPMYLDPPYAIKGHMLYNEYMKVDEHIAMAEKLKERTNWVLSYDSDDMIKELYKNNKIIDLAAKYSINGKKHSWANKNELLILQSIL